MGIFREGPSPFQTALAMVAAARDQQVLVLGPGDPQLAAEIALITGLNGRTVVSVANAAAGTAAETRAREAGALLEIEPTPPSQLTASPAFDVVVLHGALGLEDADRAIIADAYRLVRPGGRVVAIEGAARAPRGLGLFRSKTPARPAAEVRALLDAAGFKATRVLAEAGGAAYVEGIKPRA